MTDSSATTHRAHGDEFSTPTAKNRRSQRSMFQSLKHKLSKRVRSESSSSNPFKDMNEAPPPYSSASAASPQSPAAKHDDPYKFLNSFDTIFMIDDSGSKAGSRWRETSAALEAITPICTQHDADGIDIYFLNGDDGNRQRANFASTGSAKEVFDTARLQQIIKPYLRKFAASSDSVKSPNIITITDGDPSDELSASPHSLSQTSAAHHLKGALPYVPGLLNGRKVTPLGDLGASENYISERYAKKRGYVISPDGAGKTSLPNGGFAKMVGSVQLKYQFLQGGSTYEVLFRVLRRSLHDLVLGKAFLGMTNTFKHMKQRLVFKLPSLTRPVMSLGSAKQHMQGWLNGVQSNTLADSWSSVMLVSGAHAANLGLDVDQSLEHQVRLQLGDGTIVKASGMVKDLEFAYEQDGAAFAQDFYVLNDLTCDVILSCDFLMETNAFDTYYDIIFEDQPLMESDVYDATLNAIINLDENIQKLKAKSRQIFGLSEIDMGTSNICGSGPTVAKQKQNLLQRMSEVKKMADRDQRETKLAEIRAELQQLQVSLLRPPPPPAGGAAAVVM